MNVVIANNKHDRIELNHISYKFPQSGQGGGRSTSIRESHQIHGGGGEADICDEPAANGDSSSKAHTASRGESSLPKVELMSGSHETSNSSVMKATFFRNLEEHVH